MALKVVWSEEAIQNRKDLFEYWNQRNKSRVFSQKLFNLFEDNLAKLSRNPIVGRPTSIDNVRAIRVNNYRLVYAFDKERLTLLTIQDLRQEELKP
ncbi:MAG TPA: type II toxin-antitoxin system RelE/ParE family toxin [Bacteroidetes bacterium]|nr:type II toxin-antitoxin system RelE/ParE family toxin [Bacteroidota bacterium]